MQKPAMHTYRITVTRPGHQPRSHIKEFADISAATAWAKNHWPGNVRIQVEAVRLIDLPDSTATTTQEARHV